MFPAAFPLFNTSSPDNAKVSRHTHRITGLIMECMEYYRVLCDQQPVSIHNTPVEYSDQNKKPCFSAIWVDISDLFSHRGRQHVGNGQLGRALA